MQTRSRTGIWLQLKSHFTLSRTWKPLQWDVLADKILPRIQVSASLAEDRATQGWLNLAILNSRYRYGECFWGHHQQWFHYQHRSAFFQESADQICVIGINGSRRTVFHNLWRCSPGLQLGFLICRSRAWSISKHLLNAFICMTSIFTPVRSSSSWCPSDTILYIYLIHIVYWVLDLPRSVKDWHAMMS